MQVFLFFISLLLLNSAHAEQALSPVKVVAGDDSDLVDIPIIGHQQRIEREVFSSTYLPLDELLEQQAGIDIQSVGGNGQYSFPTIRGSSGKQVLVFWDGMLINDLNGGSADIGSLSLSSAGKIDIYRGMSPIELSPTAVGGVINIHSQELDNDSGEAGITLGSFETIDLYVSHKISSDKASLYFNINSFQSANNFSYLEQAPVNSPNDPATEKRENNGVENKTILTKLHYDFSDTIRLDASVQLQDGRREISSRINTPTNTAYIAQDAYRIQTVLSHNHQKIGRTQLRLSQQKSNELYDDEGSNVGIGSQYNIYITDKNSLGLQHDVKFNKASVVFSAGLENEQVQTEFPHEDAIPETCSLGDKCETDFIRNALNYGSRFNIALTDNFNFMQQIAKLEYNDKNESNDIEQEFDQHFSATTYDTGLSYQFTNGLAGYIKTGKQVRPPSSSELFGDRGTTKGNPDLIAEKSQYNEIGLSLSHSIMTFDTSIYQRILTDTITPTTDSRGIISFENIAKTKHTGIELISSLDWSNQWRSSLNVTLQDNEIIDHSNHAFIGNQVGDYSQIHSYFSTSWHWQNLTILGSQTFQTGGYYNSLNSLPRDTKNEWNLSATWQQVNWLVSLEGKNLTDDRARDYPEIPEPGRQFYLKLIYNW